MANANVGLSGEVWKTIPNTNNVYEASNMGQVRRKVGMVRNNVDGGERQVGGKPLSPKTKRNGYKEVNLYFQPNVSKMVYVHRAVASAFYGEIPEKMEVNHKDGDKANNRLSNLEIITKSENILHSIHKLGNRAPVFRGSASAMAKLNEATVFKIRALYAEGKTPRQISKQFDTPFSTICKVCYRHSWKHT